MGKARDVLIQSCGEKPVRKSDMQSAIDSARARAKHEEVSQETLDDLEKIFPAPEEE